MQIALERNSIGLTPCQLERLCQNEQLERTLHLLFYLNDWARVRERLFFVDRQGLYRVKAALLRQAYEMGVIEAIAYIDGIAGLGKDITPGIAADVAAERAIERSDLRKLDPEVSSSRYEDACLLTF